METRSIGSLEVTVVGVGCNNFGTRLDETQTAAVVRSAVDHGINLFDTADVYGTGLSEEYLGAAIRSIRDEVVIATKFGAEMPDGGGASIEWIERSVEDSLRRLHSDHIDLYQLHVPDPDTPTEVTLEALDRLVTAGKVREIGCSNVTADWLDATLATSAERESAAWVSVQNHYSLLHREPEEDGVLDACGRHGLGMLPYFPLASGMLTGKYRPDETPPEGTRLGSIPAERAERFINDQAFAIVGRLEAFAADRDRTLLELAFGYLLSRPQVASVIAGATKPEQIAANAGAGHWRLSADELAELEGLASR